MYHPSQEMAQLSNVPQIKNGKPNFSPTFQKVELHNSTFFQSVASEPELCWNAQILWLAFAFFFTWSISYLPI